MKTLIIICSLIFSASSFSAVEVTSANPLPTNAIEIGNVSFSDINGSMSDIVKGLEYKANKMGGSYFKITSLEITHNPRGTATVYK